MNTQNDFMDFEQLRNCCLITKAIIDDLRPLFFQYYNAIIDPNGTHRIREYDLSFSEISDDGISIEYTYNDSCNCHPEYTTDEFCIPWDFIQKFHEDPEATKLELAELNKKRIEEEARKKAEKAEKERREQLAADRRQLEALKKKLGE